MLIWSKIIASQSVCKNSAQSINSFSRFKGLMNWPNPFLTKPTQKSLKWPSTFLNLYQHAKNQFIPWIHFWDTANFRVPWPDRPHPFLAIPTQKIFDQFLIYVNLYRHAKDQDFFNLFWRYGWLKNTAIWLNENILAHISQILNLCRNIANNINFHYRTNSVKINDNFSINSKNHVFGPFLVQFLYFGGKNFSGKSGSLMHNFIWVSSTMPKLRKN